MVALSGLSRSQQSEQGGQRAERFWKSDANQWIHDFGSGIEDSSLLSAGWQLLLNARELREGSAWTAATDHLLFGVAGRVAGQARPENQPDDWASLNFVIGALEQRQKSAWANELAELIVFQAIAEEDFESADKVLQKTLGFSKEDKAGYMELLLYQVEVDRKLWRWTSALSRLRSLEFDLNAVVGPENGAWRDMMLARVFGASAQCYLDTGLFSDVARLIGREGAMLDSLEARGVQVPQARGVHAMNRVELCILSGDHFGAVEVLEEPLVADALDSDYFAGYSSLYEGIAKSYEWTTLRSSSSRADLVAQGAGMQLEAAVADFRLGLGVRSLAYRALADHRIMQGQLVEAEEALIEGVEARGVGLRSDEILWLEVEARLALARSLPREELKVLLDEYEAAFDEYLAAWEGIERPPGGINFLWIAERRAALATLLDLKVEALSREEGLSGAFESLMRAQAVGSYALSVGAGAPTVEEIQSTNSGLLGPKHGLLVFLPGVQRLRVFCLDRENLHSFVVGDLPSLRADVRLFESLLGQHTSANGRGGGHEQRVKRLEAISKRCAESLLSADVLRVVGKWDAVSVVGNEAFGLYHIEGLMLGDELDTSGGVQAEGLLFGEKWAVDYLPSVPLGIQLAGRPLPTVGQGENDLLIFGALQPPPKAFDLNSKLFAKAIDRKDLAGWISSHQSVLTVLEEEATYDRLKRMDLSSQPVIHFFAHGVFNPEFLRGASLAFSESDSHSGLVSCPDIENLRVSGLVVLSACGTAKGPRRIGDDEPAHLGGAFLSAGARAVIVSRSDVQYEWTLEAMSHFHQLLRSGMTVAESLRRARLESSQNGDPWSRWYGARMQIVGAGQYAPFPDAKRGR